MSRLLPLLFIACLVGCIIDKSENDIATESMLMKKVEFIEGGLSFACGEFSYALGDSTQMIFLHLSYQGEIESDTTFHVSTEDENFSATLIEFKNHQGAYEYFCNDVAYEESPIQGIYEIEDAEFKIEVTNYKNEMPLFDDFQLQVQSESVIQVDYFKVQPFTGPIQAAGWLPG